MPYCTQADLEERYGTGFLVQLTDRAELATGSIDAGAVTRAISEADALIDGYVKGRYVLPFAVTPDPIATISRQIAIYVLHTHEPNEKIVRDYKDAIAALRDIAKGVVQLDAAGITPAGTGQGDVRVTQRDRPFSAQTMKGLI
jgi:phage gp36-like protein